MSYYLTLTLQKITPFELTTKSNPCIGICSKLPSLFISCIVFNPNYNETNSEPRVMKESHFYVNDDKEHDFFFVQHCLLLHWCQIVDHGIRPQEHWVFSYGCVGQFQGAQTIFFVVVYPKLTNYCKMRWQFFGIAHSKGNFKFNISIQVHVVIIELQFCFVDFCTCELMI